MKSSGQKISLRRPERRLGVCRNSVIATASIALFWMTSSHALAEDLCPKSYAWFACTLNNGKSVAICGSPSVDLERPKFGTDSNAWLQYRYGRPGRFELQHPTGQGDSLWRDFLGAVVFAPGGTPTRINFSFIKDDKRYLIQGNRRADQTRYSLSVLSERPVRTLAEWNCTSVDTDNLLPIALAVPCDPNDAGNETRGMQCK
jgi:hypothetical protein